MEAELIRHPRTGEPLGVEPEEFPEMVEPEIKVCPACGSWKLIAVEYDFGICSQTGYHEAGERFRCTVCGDQGDADELVCPNDDSQIKEVA